MFPLLALGGTWHACCKASRLCVHNVGLNELVPGSKVSMPEALCIYSVFGFFSKIDFIFGDAVLCVSVCGCVHVRARARRGQRRQMDPLELEL